MKTSLSASRVTELQGPYGPLQVLEIKVQQVWALQQFQAGRWMTQDGRELKVRSPGLWNRGSGPDFREAVLEMDGEVRVGDVEIHLYREDWWRHGHAMDPGYNKVILHVVLFGGGMDHCLRTESGEEPVEWVMGPWMREDVESISGGEPGLFGERIPEIREWIESDTAEILLEKLRFGADRRWQDKESMARCLLEAGGWAGSLHRMVLYYLGFPANRRAFYELAERFPPECWRDERILDEVRSQWSDRIQWRLGRPANRAAPRLEQYITLNHLQPDWMENLRKPPRLLIERLQAILEASGAAIETGDVRRLARFSGWESWLHGTVCAGTLGAGLLRRLWVDVFLPLMLVQQTFTPEEAAALWFHAYPGQYPAAYNPLLRLAGTRQACCRIRCNGWIQGLLWMEDQMRMERIRTACG
ncbi:MAG: DUF2851 family protein [Puniceicoccaceae bacterium]